MTLRGWAAEVFDACVAVPKRIRGLVQNSSGPQVGPGTSNRSGTFRRNRHILDPVTSEE